MNLASLAAAGATPEQIKQLQEHTALADKSGAKGILPRSGALIAAGVAGPNAFNSAFMEANAILQEPDAADFNRVLSVADANKQFNTFMSTLSPDQVEGVRGIIDRGKAAYVTERKLKPGEKADGVLISKFLLEAPVDPKDPNARVLLNAQVVSLDYLNAVAAQRRQEQQGGSPK